MTGSLGHFCCLECHCFLSAFNANSGSSRKRGVLEAVSIPPFSHSCSKLTLYPLWVILNSHTFGVHCNSVSWTVVNMTYECGDEEQWETKDQ